MARLDRTLPIAVFDSGVGGLTVLHELLVHLPEEDFVYLGDTARFPYGERSADELERFCLQIAEDASPPREIGVMVAPCTIAVILCRFSASAQPQPRA